jgi:hypothetical protein
LKYENGNMNLKAKRFTERGFRKTPYLLPEVVCRPITAADGYGQERVDARLTFQVENKALVKQALAGELDEKQMTSLMLRLPGDAGACGEAQTLLVADEWARRLYPYTRACLAVDLIERGHHRAREFLIDAWSHCHVTTIRSLGGVPATVSAFERVRDRDPHIAKLPEKVTLYRGEEKPGRGARLSWTFDAERARWFSTRFWPHHGSPAAVVERQIKRADVLAVIGDEEGRGEREVLLWPSRWRSSDRIVWEGAP